MTLPPLQLSSSSKSGDLSSSFGNDASGWNVNFGNGVSQGGSLGQPSPLLLAAVAFVAVLWLRKK